MPLLSLRCARRDLVSLTLAAGALVLARNETAAGRGWCRSDPVILIDGHLSDIMVEAPLAALLKVNGPTEIVVTVPRGTSTKLLIPGVGFGRGEQVRFDESGKLRATEQGVQVKVAVRVPATDDEMSVGIAFSPHVARLDILKPELAEGTANDWVALKTVV